MQIHWHEGLFLLPHHLQRFQRSVLEKSAHQRALAIHYPYGVIDIQVAEGELENMRVRFKRLRAIMPSGIEVNYPDGAVLPSVDIKKELDAEGSVLVSLGVPLWFASRSNCLAKDRPSGAPPKILYELSEEEVNDENTGGNPKPMIMRKVNARLLLDGEDRSDLEVIPLFRVTRIAGATVGLPQQDPEFVGPCLVLNASTSLKELVRGLTSQVQASREELVLQLRRASVNLDTLRGIQFEQMLRLQTLNRAGSRLGMLVRAPNVTPFEVFLVMRDLLGDLSGLYPERDLYETGYYDHDNPYPAFNEVAAKIRLVLRGGVSPHFIQVPFVEQDGMLRAQLSEEHFTTPNNYFLGIRSKEDPLSLAQFVENEDRFKLMPASMAARAVRGILLQEERFPPLELPAQSGLYYFRLRRTDCPDVWKLLQEERSAVVRWIGNENADYQVTLFMTLPPEP